MQNSKTFVDVKSLYVKSKQFHLVLSQILAAREAKVLSHPHPDTEADTGGPLPRTCSLIVFSWRLLLTMHDPKQQPRTKQTEVLQLWRAKPVDHLKLAQCLAHPLVHSQAFGPLSDLPALLSDLRVV